jgi:superfamily II DNA helicase RecQ
LPDPDSLTPVVTRAKVQTVAPVSDADQPLLDALKAWRTRVSDGKPAYTVAHNSTLQLIATLKPSTLDELETIRGVGPAFVDRYGEQVLMLVGDQRVDVVAGE